MSNRAERRALQKKVTDDLLSSKFTRETGWKAVVDRTSIENEHLDKLRAVLRDIGEDLLRVGAVPKGMQYMGSLSVHVYKSEILQSIAYATISANEKIPFDVADGALRELTSNTFVSYGKAQRKRRSGAA